MTNRNIILFGAVFQERNEGTRLLGALAIFSTILLRSWLLLDAADRLARTILIVLVLL